MSEPRKKYYTTACYFIMTENCNLRCVYCFEKTTRAVTKTIDLGSAHKVVDMLFEQAKAQIEETGNQNALVDITFFGGEPCLALDECEDILEYACNKRDETGIKTTFLIITNATIYNEKVEHFLQLWYDRCGSVMVQLSIDGIPEIQNANRPCANHNIKSSDLVEANIVKYKEWMKSHNVSWDHLFVHCVVSKASLPKLYENYVYFARKLDVRFEFAWVYEDAWDDDDIVILDNSLDRIVADMSQWCNYTHLFPFKRANYCTGCGSGKQLISMDTEGNLYPCHRFFFYSMESREAMCLGNINDENPINEDIRQKFIDLEEVVATTDPCQMCAAVNYETSGQIDIIPNIYGIEFMKVLNKYYNIFVEIIERKMMTMNIRNLTTRCENLERTIIRLASLMKVKLDISDEELPIINQKTGEKFTIRCDESKCENCEGCEE